MGLKKNKYSCVKEQIVLRIQNGIYPQGSVIPKEFELMSEFGVSRNTVRQALQELESEGCLQRRRRWGTIVCTPSGIHSRKIALFLYECFRSAQLCDD